LLRSITIRNKSIRYRKRRLLWNRRIPPRHQALLSIVILSLPAV
jgi:hypothetical protein